MATTAAGQGQAQKPSGPSLPPAPPVPVLPVPQALGAAAKAGGAATAAAVGVTAATLHALSQVLAKQRMVNRRWLAEHAGPRPGAATLRQLETERQRETTFARVSAGRVTAGMPKALALASPEARQAAVKQLLSNERRFTVQQATESMRRLQGAVNFDRVQESSPLGAMWLLGPAKDHTAGCVSPDTAIGAVGVRSVMRRRYVGKLVEATTARGRILAVTPNHPVLTARGWLAADLLNEGDYLVNPRGGELGAGTDQNFYDCPATAQEIFDSLASLGALVRAELPIGPEDFHGDGQHGHVDVVGADGALLDGLVSALPERGGDFRFMLSDRGLAHLASQRGAASAGVGVHRLLIDSAYRDPCAAQSQGERTAADAEIAAELEHGFTREVAVGGSVREGVGVGFGAAARSYSEAAQGLVDGAGVDAVSSSELDRSLSRLVAPDEIVRVRRVPFSGHVYNLSTRGGWYMTEQLAAHNCMVMQRRFWPWAVLVRVSPPRHPGCTGYLVGLDEAVGAGLMTMADIPTLYDAINDASGVMMEGAAERLLGELELREQLIARGVGVGQLARIPWLGEGYVAEAFDAGEHPRDFLGRWRDVGRAAERMMGPEEAAAALKRGEPAAIRPEDTPRLVDELHVEEGSSLHLLQIGEHPNLFRAHARELRREQMPQIPKAHLPGFMDFLREHRVMATVEEVAPSSLRATQNQINGAAVAHIAKGWDPTKGGILMVSHEGDVLDGHHRWAGAAMHEMTNPGHGIRVLRFSADTDRMLQLMREYNAVADIPVRAFGTGPKLGATG